MRLLILTLLLLPGLAAIAQNPTNYEYRPMRERRIAVMADSTLHVAAGIYPSLRNGGSGRAGALFVDTVGGGAGLHYYLGGSWVKLADSADAAGGNFGKEDNAAAENRSFNQGSNTFAFTGSGQLSLGNTLSGSAARVIISNPTSGTQHLHIGSTGSVFSNNVYVSINTRDTLTTANNKSTGMFNQYEHDVRNNISMSGWGFGNHLSFVIPDTMRADPLGSDLAGSILTRTLLKPNTTVNTGRHVIKGGTFRDDHVGGVISMIETSGTNSTDWVHLRGFWASFIGHLNFSGAKDSIETWSPFWVTNINAGHGNTANGFHMGPVGGFDTVKSFISPYQNAYMHQAGSAYFGSAVNGNYYVAAPSAQVQIQSTTKGVLLPTMTGTQQGAIGSPATGLLIYNTDSTAFTYYNGTAWRALAAGSGGGGGSQTWQQTLTTGSTLTGNNTIAGGGFNFYMQDVGNFRVYGTGSFSSERLVVTSGSSGVAILGRESTSVYYQGSDSLYTIGLGQKIDTVQHKVVVRDILTGALAYAPWMHVGWGLQGNAATAGSQTGSFIGTTNSVAMRWRTNNTQRMELDSSQAQLRLGGVSSNTADGLRIKNPGSGNYDGYYVEHNSGTNGTWYGAAGITRAGGISIKTTSGSISMAPNTGVFFGTEFTSATANIHIKASTTAANTGQIKLNEGSRQTTPEDGTINYVSNNLEFVETSTVYTLAKTLKATASLDFPSTTTQNSNDLTITVTGAATGDPVALAIPHGLASTGTTFTAWVSSTHTVTVRFNNYSTGTVDLGSDSFTVTVIHY